MVEYVLKLCGCLLILYCFYRLFLENEKIHTFKRCYLLFSLLLAIVIPFITITYEVATVFEAPEVVAIPYSPGIVQEMPVVEQSEKDFLPLTQWCIYALGVVCFFYRLINNLWNLRNLIRRNEHIKEGIGTKVLLPFRQIPYSYFRYIFVEKRAFLSNKIPKEIIKHEEAHVVQYHTLDLLILEVLQIIFWFNPLFYFIKKSMRLNHEFLADEAVLQQNVTPTEYSNLLINSSFGNHQPSMTSPFKNSLIKKRIIMISNSFSKKRAGLKIGFLVPVLCCCIYFFNNEIVAKAIPINKADIKEEYLELSNTDYQINADSMVYGRINYLNLKGKDYQDLRTITNRWAIKNKKEKILGDKKLEISIEGQDIEVNGESVNADQFVQAINTTTNSWTKQDIMLYTMSMSLDSKENPLFYELANSFRKTDVFKTDPSHEMVIYEAKAEDVIRETVNSGGVFYFNDQRISVEKASELLKDPNSYNYIKSFEEKDNSMALKIWNDQIEKAKETGKSLEHEEKTGSQKVNIGKQTLDQIRTHMPNRIVELIERGDVTFFEDGKEISGPEALTLAKKVRDGERDMILTQITGSKTPTMWANIRSITINEDYSFSLKYEESYPGRTTFE